MQLEYFDCIRFTIVDPMHNLFLGTAKHMMKNVWLPNKVLKQTGLKSIQELIDNMKVPCNIGRIPNKIASSFGSFTSDQWKLWTLVYSEFALKNYLPREDYRLALVCESMPSINSSCYHDSLSCRGTFFTDTILQEI